ncbi:MAG TPA: hypothetical protein VGQ76_06850 [Thermoanaerobaculia bacterium]|jgi:hypothetical protein|nr:hypothetical protein [Thermoanaerobaculia bacterium]
MADDDRLLITFVNVTISLYATTPEQGYAELCDALRDFEYDTHRYTVIREGASGWKQIHEGGTEELFPAELEADVDTGALPNA